MCVCEARVSQVSTHLPFCHIEILHDIRIWAHSRASKFALQIYLELLYQPHGPQFSILRVQERVEQTQNSCPKLAPTYHKGHESFSSLNQLLHLRFPPRQKRQKEITSLNLEYIIYSNRYIVDQQWMNEHIIDKPDNMLDEGGWIDHKKGDALRSI